MRLLLNKEELEKLNEGMIVCVCGIEISTMKKENPKHIEPEVGEIYSYVKGDKVVTSRYFEGTELSGVDIVPTTVIRERDLIKKEEAEGSFWSDEMHRYLKLEDIECNCITLKDKLDVYIVNPDLVHKETNIDNKYNYIRSCGIDKICNNQYSNRHRMNVSKETFIAILKNYKIQITKSK